MRNNSVANEFGPEDIETTLVVFLLSRVCYCSRSLTRDVVS